MISTHIHTTNSDGYWFRVMVAMLTLGSPGWKISCFPFWVFPGGSTFPGKHGMVEAHYQWLSIFNNCYQYLSMVMSLYLRAMVDNIGSYAWLISFDMLIMLRLATATHVLPCTLSVPWLVNATIASHHNADVITGQLHLCGSLSNQQCLIWQVQQAGMVSIRNPLPV